jgi:mono/diheme cytochrome c family protein
MLNRSGNFKGRIALSLVVLLAVPLLGWNMLPKSASSGMLGSSRVSGGAVLQSSSAQGAPAGNVEKGRDLFMGRLHFKNDGPPCMGCHNVGSNGILGGGALGPDLTNISTKRSQSEIASILSNNEPRISPVMQPIYSEHPLTESEQADLIAFLNASVGQPESNKEILVIGISFAGFVGAVVVLGFVYRNRLRGVRKSLLKKAQPEKR